MHTDDFAPEEFASEELRMKIFFNDFTIFGEILSYLIMPNDKVDTYQLCTLRLVCKDWQRELTNLLKCFVKRKSEQGLVDKVIPMYIGTAAWNKNKLYEHVIGRPYKIVSSFKQFMWKFVEVNPEAMLPLALQINPSCCLKGLSWTVRRTLIKMAPGLCKLQLEFPNTRLHLLKLKRRDRFPLLYNLCAGFPMRHPEIKNSDIIIRKHVDYLQAIIDKTSNIITLSISADSKDMEQICQQLFINSKLSIVSLFLYDTRMSDELLQRLRHTVTWMKNCKINVVE